MRYRNFGFLLCITAALVACDGANAPSASSASTPASPPASIATAPTPASSAAGCPDADFDAFLKRFEASADVQRSASADPLTMSSLDTNAQPEPATVTRQVPRSEVEFPVMADAATRKVEGSELRVDTRSAAEQTVVIALPDSDAQVRFDFTAKPCWTLVRVTDSSL